MSNPLSNLEPKAVFHYFGELNKCPRPSKKEEKVVEFVENWAKERNIELQKDKRGNLILRKPATPGMENKQSVCLQGHLDMVCVNEPDYNIDFEKDGITSYVDGDWVKAKGTSLGADDGIAIAMGLALLDSKDIPHPALELLCTLDEETGLTGAAELGTDMIKSKILINIDSESEGVFTIGCAGGINTTAIYKYESDTVPQDTAAYKITVDGLLGGHSGIEINAGHANASKILTRILWDASAKFGIRVSTFDGGTKHNAIPSNACSIIVVDKNKTTEYEAFIKEMEQTIQKEFATKEKGLTIKTSPTEKPHRIFTKDFQFRLLASFYSVPHGVLRMSPDIPGLVQSSTNFAIVETHEDSIFVLTSQRSSVGSEKINIVNKVKAAFELGGATVSSTDGYPAWEPSTKSKILEIATEVYKNLPEELKIVDEPKIEAIHAGLECGLIGDKYPGMDMLSIGPNLQAVHSPAEKLSISSTKRLWGFLLELLKNIPNK